MLQHEILQRQLGGALLDAHLFSALLAGFVADLGPALFRPVGVTNSTASRMALKPGECAARLLLPRSRNSGRRQIRCTISTIGSSLPQ